LSQLQLFQAQFEQLVNHDHPLFVLAGQIDWARFDAALAGCLSPDQGAPAKAVRLLVGLHYLKHTFNESDESLVDRWVENPYWQYFCGFETTQHQWPLHPTSLTKWRQRVGADKLAEFLGETLALALAANVCTPSSQKKRRKRRSAVEPKVGHLKSGNCLGRCFLKGLTGDAINAILAAAGSNL